MDRNLSLFVLFSLLLFFSAFSSATEDLAAVSEAEPLIRQVVDGGDLRLKAEHHFSLFKHRFGKSYGSKEEHDFRFKVFRANLRRAQRHQNLDPSAVHGVTLFSDLTPSEFRKKVLGLRGLRFPADTNKAPILPTDDLPKDFDWRDHGAVTSVKNQVLLFFFSDMKSRLYLDLFS